MKNSINWKINEVQQRNKLRRELVKQRFQVECERIDEECRRRKREMKIKEYDELEKIDKEEDDYLAKYSEYCENRRAEIREVYRMKKEMEGGEQ